MRGTNAVDVVYCHLPAEAEKGQKTSQSEASSERHHTSSAGITSHSSNAYEESILYPTQNAQLRESAQADEVHELRWTYWDG